MKTVAFIFARGGSKGLPGKNIRHLCGKPLIAWSIECALSLKQIDRVIVSTDSDEIASVAIKYGAEVPFMRPTHLATDTSPEWLSWQHALKYLEDSTGSLPEVMLSIPATAPLRLPIDIENCLNAYEKGNTDIVITVTDAHRNPYFNMVKLDSDGIATVVNSTSPLIARRQDAPPVYDMTTICYVANSKFVMSQQGIFDGKVKSVYVPMERAIDIDTLFDFTIAENLMLVKQSK